ncbi:MAG TPA: aminoacetone oxidase family FAD-binding enzyme, partial [Pseudomonas sp.]|nr:aminoacetone oxidase family FAD-binding enzyme [Pseudomonas sp.]
MVSRHGVPYHEKKLGQLFCDNKASDILGMLLDECQQAGVDIRLNTSVQSIERSKEGYLLQSSAGELACQSLVIATGGLSIPTLGASGFGYQIARQFGHRVLPTRAGLVPFTITEPQLKGMCEALSGTSVEDCLVSCNGQSFRENILFTHRGLSGPAILQVSSYWQPGDAIEINLLPQLDVIEWLDEQRLERPNTELKTLLGELFTRKMAGLLAEHWFVSKPLKQYSQAELQEIAEKLGSWQLVPAGTEGYRTAEVTLGGVDTREVSSKTMESQQAAGLYFIGEVLDVTGHLGGFNFQWAWASGYAAAQYV